MIKCGDWPIAVCSWSLGNDFDKIKTLADQTGIGYIHLALSPALREGGEEYLARFKRLGLKISAGMIDFPQENYSTLEAIRVTGGIVPDEHWEANKRLAFGVMDAAAKLGVRSVSTHIGFIDLENADAAKKLTERTKTLADYAAGKKIVLLMETGQETAGELKKFLEKLNHPALAVNFDPANLILYNKGNPIEAVQILARWVRHVHIKDATYTSTAGTWGTEVPWGQGQVNAEEFLRTLRKIKFKGEIAVERESGDNRAGDIKSAVEKLKGFANS